MTRRNINRPTIIGHEPPSVVQLLINFVYCWALFSCFRHTIYCNLQYGFQCFNVCLFPFQFGIFKLRHWKLSTTHILCLHQIDLYYSFFFLISLQEKKKLYYYKISNLPLVVWCIVTLMIYDLFYSKYFFFLKFCIKSNYVTQTRTDG